MSLINCPSCQKKISDKVKLCPNCKFSFEESHDEIERLKILQYRKYRNSMYRFRMLSFFAIALTVAGLVPMLWSYAKAIDYGFNVKFTNHWGLYLVMAGFGLYVVTRIFMFNTKRLYNTSKKQNT